MAAARLNRKAAGARWEKAAASFLRSQGCTLLQSNFTSRFGEIDLIMEDHGTLVFVEVKYRRCTRHGTGADAVGFHKRSRIAKTAAWYLAENPGRSEQACRFDVVAIDRQAGRHEFNWIRNAFH